MPISRFECPDKVEIPVSECLESCRLGSRCVPKSVLLIARREREHKPILSASQAGKGLRQIVLEAFQPYAINPRTTVWALIGVSGHYLLQESGARGIAETRFEYPKDDPYVTGQIDFYDMDEEVLYDYKVWGSYKIKKVLDKDEDTIFEVSYQTNAYRLFLLEEGFEVKGIRLIVIPRDGGTYIAKQRNIAQEVICAEVPFVDLDVLKQFYRIRTEILKNSYKTGDLPPFCSQRETWNKRKCQKFCPVAVYCNPPWL